MQRFDNKQTEALLAVLDHGSFERAAQELRLTPSAVSQRVRALEAQLGMPLVERTRPCRPTAPGRALLQYLRRSKLLAEEFASTFADSEAFIHAPIATNHDSLETWLLPALAPVATAEKVLLQLSVDDQEFTHQKLLDGSVVAAISSKDTPMKGCDARPLGTVRYRLMASPVFKQNYFAQGLTHAALRLAPLVRYNHKDFLQHDFLREFCHFNADASPQLTIPSTQAFYRAVELGLGYGMILDVQQQQLQGDVVDLMPGAYVDVPLYWHYWQVQSPKMQRLNQALIQHASAYLLPLSA